MNKRIWLVLCLLCLSAAARAQILPPEGPGQLGVSAVVLCERLTLRASPSAGARAVGTLPYGACIAVARRESGWAECYTSDALDAPPAGWVDASYLALDPAWLATERATPVYAWPDRAAPRVALLPRGETFPILREQPGWLLISLRGAAGWVER